jgi:hypothetical protein
MPAPEKDYFTLEEVARRWGCDQASFLTYARQDILTFSVYLRDLGSYRTVEETEDERITRTHTVAFSMTAPGYKSDGLRYLLADDARRILESVLPEQVGVSVLYKSPQRIKKHGTGYLAAKYFTREDLVIDRGERDRFEVTHKVIKRRGALLRYWLWLKDTENQKPLALIGGAIAAVIAAAWTGLLWFTKLNSSP